MSMSRLAPLLAACLCAVPLSTLPQEVDARGEVEAAIVAFGQAFVEADVARLDSLLTEDYVHINGRSGTLLSRADWLRWVGSRRAEIDSGQLVIQSYEVKELSIQMYGQAAVATGEVYSTGLREGHAFSSGVRFSNLWVLEGGEWRRAAFHDTPLGE